MRKWILGLLCGAIVMLLTAVAPSSAIQGTTFPSMITIHSGNIVTTINGSGNHGVINYNNKAYVSLRLFSEAMGASVVYKPASEQSNGMHKIDIYQENTTLEWKLKHVGQVESNCAPAVPLFVIPGDMYDDNDHTFHAQIHNNMIEDISVNPIELTFQVRKTDFQEIVYSRSLPTFSGLIPSSYAYNVSFTWDHTGMDGKVLPPGDYFIELARPSTVNYNVPNSTEQETVSVNREGGCNLGYYGVTLR